MSDLVERRLVATPDNERYLVQSRLEITAILRSLIDHSALITVYFGDHGEFIVTAILSINPEFEELVFDYGADASVNQRLLESPRLTFATQLDHIRIQFESHRAQTTSSQGSSAFRVRMPDELIRLQRRDNYRVKVPLSRPVNCTLRLDPKRGGTAVAVRIYDVSGGGLALIDYPQSLQLTPGEIYQGCQLDLRDVGRVTTDIEIIHVLEKTGRNVTRTRLCGCCFRNMPNATLMVIRRYISKLEREQMRSSADAGRG